MFFIHLQYREKKTQPVQKQDTLLIKNLSEFEVTAVRIKTPLNEIPASISVVSPDSVKGHWIPQCPEHILAVETAVMFLKHFTFALNMEYQSKWYIQTDDSIYNQFTENGKKRNSWVKGFNTYGATLSYKFNIGGCHSEISLFAKNLFDEQYFGFTEPNNGPDYNSFQAAPGREFFLSLKLRF